MRWILGGGVVALIAAYFGWAYLTLYQLDSAVREQDNAALDELVDWDSVGYRLEQDLSALFDPAPPSDGEDISVAEALLGLFSNLLIGPIANFYASPEGLAYLLNAQIVLENPGEILDADFPANDTWFDHIAIAYPSGPASFTARVVYPENSGGALDGDAIELRFQFQQFRWQLVEVKLPLESLQDDVGETK